MRPAFITFAAKKTVAVIVSGLVVIGGGSIALATVSTSSETEPDPLLEEVCVEDETTTETECPVEPEPCVEDETTTETECPVEPAPEDVTDPVDEGPAANAHGKAVSDAARNTCPKGPGHGACVSQVARSKGESAEEPVVEEPVVEAAPVEEAPQDEIEASSADEPAKGNGKSNAGGNGNAGGKR